MKFKSLEKAETPKIDLQIPPKREANFLKIILIILWLLTVLVGLIIWFHCRSHGPPSTPSPPPPLASTTPAPIIGDSCGGILWARDVPDDVGQMTFPVQAGEVIGQGVVCVWIIKTKKGQPYPWTQFRLDRLDPNSTVYVHPGHDLLGTKSYPFILNSDSVGSKYDIGDDLVIVVMIQTKGSSSGIAFSWDSKDGPMDPRRGEDNSTIPLQDCGASSVCYTDQIDGSLSLNTLRSDDRFEWGLNRNLMNGSQDDDQQIDVVIHFVSNDNCTQDDGSCGHCSEVGLFEIMADGSLRQIVRICTTSYLLMARFLPPRLMAFVKVPVVSATGFYVDYINISWRPSIDKQIYSRVDVRNLYN